MSIDELERVDRPMAIPPAIRGAAYAVPLCALPSALWRLSVVVRRLTEGVGPCDQPGWGQDVYIVALSVVSVSAAYLTVGLVRPWGDRFPGWLPLIGGRAVPARAVTTVALTGASGLALLTLYAFTKDALGIAVRSTAPPGCRPPGGGVALLYLPLPLWSPLLFTVALHYRHRHGVRVTGPGFGVAVRAVAAAAVGGVAGLAAMGLAAGLAPVAWVFVSTGFVVYASVTAAVLWRWLRPRPSERRRPVVAATVGVGLALLALGTLRPLGDPLLPPRPVEGMAYWELPTGSRIAYTRTAAPGAGGDDPVVFLHGGPGVADLAGGTARFGPLAVAAGRDVYVYDQAGSGWSDRFDDPRRYTPERQADDLEAIRRRIGAERLVLVAHSWGAEIAGVYLARHPDHVAGVVLLAPGGVPGADGGFGGDPQDRLSRRQLVGLYRLLLEPRATLGYGLTQVDPRAARDLVGDAEMDARFDRIYARTVPGLHCRGQEPDTGPGGALHSLGYYSWQYMQSTSAPAMPDVRAEVAASSVPILVVKPSCDYLSWGSAETWHDVRPDAGLVYLEGAGHDLYEDRPADVVDLITRFLAGDEVPSIPWPDGPPPTYEGPAN